jgi:hypothetical protein
MAAGILESLLGTLDALLKRAGTLRATNVFHFGPHEPASAIGQRVLGAPDTVPERLRVVDEVLGPVMAKRVGGLL